MTVNPYRHLLITAGADGQWRAWDVKAMSKPMFEGNGHNGSIHRTECHPSGSFFATAGMDAVVNFWATEDGSKRLKVQHSHPGIQNFHTKLFKHIEIEVEVDIVKEIYKTKSKFEFEKIKSKVKIIKNQNHSK